jgi:hypothetical protein
MNDELAYFLCMSVILIALVIGSFYIKKRQENRLNAIWQRLNHDTQEKI